LTQPTVAINAAERCWTGSFTIPRSKIVDERLIAKVKALREEGRTQEEIAVELGVVQSTVSAVLRRGGLDGRLQVDASSVADDRDRRRGRGSH
jgi:IS30 family transposase